MRHLPGSPMHRTVAIFCSLLLPSLGFAQAPVGDFSSLPPGAQQGVPQPGAPLLSPENLDNLVAPIALYPDPLLGQVLAASTYPLEVVEAGQWLQQNGGLQGAQRIDAAKEQNWDPSVQALVAFPDALKLLTSDVRWTTDLGNAFLAQQSDVMSAVQRMRARARANGRLATTPQQVVTSETQDNQSAIEIQPADPQVIYVPQYDPGYVWGPSAWGAYPDLWYPGFGYGYSFGPGIYIGGFFPGWGGWGGWGWGPGWFGHGLFVNTGFFNRYGFRGGFGGGFANRGFGFTGRGAWAHDPGHRMGVPYSNRGVASQFGGRFGGGGFNGGRATAGGQFRGANGANAGRVNEGRFAGGQGGARPGAGQSFRGAPSAGAGGGGWNRFSGGNSGAANSTARSFQQGSSNNGGGNYRGGNYGSGSSQSYRSPAQSYPGSSSAQSFRGASSFGSGYGGSSYNRSFAPSSSTPRGSNFSAPRSFSAPSAPSRSYSAPRSFSAPHSSGGGSSFSGGRSSSSGHSGSSGGHAGGGGGHRR